MRRGAPYGQAADLPTGLVRRVREALGWTRRVMGAALGISDTSVKQKETGLRPTRRAEAWGLVGLLSWHRPDGWKNAAREVVDALYEENKS